MSAPDRGEVRERVARELLAITGPWKTVYIGGAWRKADLSAEGVEGVEKRWAEYAADRILRALREGQEPVAWRRWEDGMWIYYESEAWPDLVPLYASPVPPEPVESEPLDVIDEAVRLLEKYGVHMDAEGQLGAIRHAVKLLRAPTDEGGSDGE